MSAFIYRGMLLLALCLNTAGTISYATENGSDTAAVGTINDNGACTAGHGSDADSAFNHGCGGGCSGGTCGTGGCGGGTGCSGGTCGTGCGCGCGCGCGGGGCVPPKG